MTLLIAIHAHLSPSVLMLVALGGCFSEHSGVINLGLEGIMVIGALGGALVDARTCRAVHPDASCTDDPAQRLAAAASLLGVLYSALLAVACINFKADQTIVGTALNMLGVARGDRDRQGDQHGSQPRRCVRNQSSISSRERPFSFHDRRL